MTVTINIQKLPSLELEMRGALRSHIMKKRQRLKQEMEQDAIMERMKKEREQKRIQDAMTLDQIKEQLSVLEKKLEVLRDEKHNLFVQLKQVLSEGSSKRKESDSKATHSPESEEKRIKLEDGSNDETQSTDRNKVQSQTHNKLSTTPDSNQSLSTASKKTSTMTEDKPGKNDQDYKKSTDSRQSQSPLVHQTPSLPVSALQPTTSTNDQRIRSTSFGIPVQQHSNFIMRLPSINFNHDPSFVVGNLSRPNLINLSKHEPLPTNPPVPANPVNPANSHFRNSRGPGSGSFPPDLPPEFFISTRLNQNYQKFNPQIGHELPLNSLPYDMSHSFNQNLRLPHQQQQQMDVKMLSSNNISRANIGPINKSANVIGIDDNLMDLKRGRPRGSAFHPNQFIIDGSLSHLNLINPATLNNVGDHPQSMAQSLVTPGHHEINSPFYYNPRKPLSSHNAPRLGVDFAADHIKPGVHLPGLRHHYPSQQTSPFISPNSMYAPGVGVDLKHLGALYNPVMSQQMAVDPMSHFSNSLTHPQQQERHKDQKSKMFSTNNQTDYHRQSSPKRTYR